MQFHFYHHVRSLRFIVAFAVCSFIATHTVTAQSAAQKIPHLLYGVRGGIGLNSHSGEFNGFTGTARCGQFTKGDGTGFYAGPIFEWYVNENIALSPRITFATLPGTLTAPDVFLATLPPDYTQTVTVNTEHTLDASISALSFDLLLKIQPLDFPLALYAGASIGSVVSATFKQDEKIISPADLQFGSTHAASGDIPNLNRMRSTLLFGCTYDFALSDNLMLAPELHYAMPLGSLLSNADWNIAAIQLGVQLKWATWRSIVEPPPPLPPPVKEDPPPPPRLDVAVTAKSMSKEGTLEDVVKIVVEETQSTQMFPLLTYVFFDEGSAQLPARLARRTASTRDAFSIDAITRETMAIYREVLNIVGSRMLRHPAATLTLSGMTSTGEPDVLREARCEAVKKYFTDVWSVAPERLKTTIDTSSISSTSEDRPLLEQEARRVVITSDVFDVVAPIVIDEIERSVNPPEVYFIPEVASQVGLREWSLAARQDGSMMYSNSGKQLLTSGYLWRIDSAAPPRTDAPLRYSLLVRDQAGQSKEAAGEIPVQQLTVKKKKEERIGNQRIERYRLILFAYNSAELGAVNERIVDGIRASLSPEAIVTIDGYTDRVGMEEHNLMLSFNRAKSVRAAFGSDIDESRIQLRSNGESDLFDNATPEGRYYCRTVYITIVTPAR